MSQWTYDIYALAEKEAVQKFASVVASLEKASQAMPGNLSYPEDNKNHPGANVAVPGSVGKEYRGKVARSLEEMSRLLTQIAPVMKKKQTLHKQIVESFKLFSSLSRAWSKNAPFDPMSRELVMMSASLLGPNGFKVDPAEAAQIMKDMSKKMLASPMTGKGESPLGAADVNEPTRWDGFSQNSQTPSAPQGQTSQGPPPLPSNPNRNFMGGSPEAERQELQRRALNRKPSPAAPTQGRRSRWNPFSRAASISHAGRFTKEASSWSWSVS